MMANDFAPSDFFILLRRWKKLVIVTGLVLFVLSLAVALRWSTYRSVATIQVEQPEIAANATQPLGGNPHDAAEAMADQRISLLQQKVLSNASLVEVITKFDLYASQRKHTPIAEVAERMRKHVRVTLLSSALANPSGTHDTSALAAIAFNVSFDYSNPLLTQQVTDEIVTRFLDEDLKQRRTQAQQTSDFLGAQITALETSLSEQEKKIADYQKEHGVSRPESLAFNQQQATSLMMSLQNLDTEIATNEGTLGQLRAQMANLDP